MGKFDGRVAIVTGGAGTIGEAYCKGFADGGAAVVVADMADPEPLVDELQGAGHAAIGVSVDISDRVSTEAMAEAAMDEFGRIDILVNNAAFFKAVTRGPFEDISVEEWDLTMAVNVRGPWLCSRAVLPAMKNQQHGRIINISSNVVWKGVPGFLQYTTSKSALVGFTRAMAREVGDYGITVNNVAPDFIPDDYLRAHQPGNEEAVNAARAIKRTSVPEDMVGTVLYLASDDAAFVTGQAILVNGGSFMY
ncbi:MAG: SDR family oxidoreductase [Acidimicrobiia bacterium]|nr:SDR family oxidoreductase [Acidimicrobiia bacterium]